MGWDGKCLRETKLVFLFLFFSQCYACHATPRYAVMKMKCRAYRKRAVFLWLVLHRNSDMGVLFDRCGGFEEKQVVVVVLEVEGL